MTGPTPSTTGSEVALVSMPFGAHYCPAIGLSLMKAALAQAGITSEVLYFNLSFLDRIGEKRYRFFSDPGRPADLAGEWFFAPWAFAPADGAADDRYIGEILKNRGLIPDTRADDFIQVTDEDIQAMLSARVQAGPFLEECAARLESMKPRIVGLTSMFSQHLAAVALARMIKARLPGTFVVMGGANCEGEMGAETAWRFPCLDAVISGEADEVLPELVLRVLRGEAPWDLPGLHAARAETEQKPPDTGGYPRPRDLDALPVPDYTDYFTARSAMKVQASGTYLPVETSRGCWWGQKHPCRFCGIHTSRMAYRSKSPARAFEELHELARRHPGYKLVTLDTVLDPRFFRGLLPRLARRRLPADLFYEVRPGLDKSKLMALRDAGVLSVQAGIESLSDSILRQMRKGSRALENVQLLKWCRELGLSIKWNFLWGLPGEDPAEYARMTAWVPRLAHLEPPMAAGRFQLHRFSTYFQDPERWGLRHARPAPAYAHIYPFEADSIRKLAYYHVFDYADGRDVGGYVRPLWQAVRLWWKAAADSDLFMADTGRHLAIFDLRPGAPDPLTIVAGSGRDILRACDGVRTRRRLRQLPGMPAGEAEFDRLLDPLLRQGFLLEDAGRYLALPLPLGDYSPRPNVLERFLATLAARGASADGSSLFVPLPTRGEGSGT